MTSPCLIVNLDGNAIQTLGLEARIHFDLDSNGFKELTGWIAPGNAVLMLDKNGNSSLDTANELFGDFTVLPNGMRAGSGFEALGFYDTNGDGKIDANDPVWSQLRLWQCDASIASDVMDPDISGKMSDLDEVGITAIYLDSVITNQTDNAGNTEVRRGHFEWTDHTTGTIAEYRLVRNASESVPTSAQFAEVTTEIASLPDLFVCGNVCTLRQAMIRDPSGHLQALVESFAAETTPAGRAAILDQIVFEWTDTDSVAPNARGPFRDGRKVAALEKFYGDPPENTDATLATVWTETYRRLSENFYGRLMEQTHLQDLFGLIGCAN